MTRRVSAFGALNQDTYDVFAHFLHEDVVLTSAIPYPNARAASEPGRPLRAEALADDAKKQELFAAVAADGRAAGAMDADVAVMPCTSMIAFHDGVEAALGRKILRLSTALTDYYKGADRVGVLHMRPAKKSVEAMFGASLVAPDDAQAARLLAAEEEAKATGSSAPVEAAMRDIAQAWRDQGVKRILFARADAPKAILNISLEGVELRSVYDILADAVTAAL